jgi:hypothetical protein
MSTKDESQDKSDEFIGADDVQSGEVLPPENTALANNIARLETELDGEREQRLEERFRWIVVTSLLVDVIAVSALDGSWLFLPIFMLQLIVLIGFAKAYGVDWAERLIGQLLHWVSEWGKNKSDDS